MLKVLTLLLIVSMPAVTQVGDTTPSVLWSIRLPSLVAKARDVGVTETVLRQVLGGLRDRGLTADEAAMVLREEVDAVNAGGPKDNFGGFVQQQLDAGLRGRALAGAIRAEHQARGIGGGRGNGNGRGRGQDQSGRDTTKRGRGTR